MIHPSFFALVRGWCRAEGKGWTLFLQTGGYMKMQGKKDVARMHRSLCISSGVSKRSSVPGLLHRFPFHSKVLRESEVRWAGLSYESITLEAKSPSKKLPPTVWQNKQESRVPNWANQMNVQAPEEEERVFQSWKQPLTRVVFPNGGREKVEAEACVRDDTV